MIETLVNVKNGKGKTGNGAEQSNDAAARMKKFLSGLGKKRRCRCHARSTADLQYWHQNHFASR